MTKQTIEHTNIAILVNHRELKNLIIRYTKAKKVLFIWGAIGIGKSDMVREACKEIARTWTREVEITKDGKKTIQIVEVPLEYTEDPSYINNPNYYVLLDIRLSQLDPSDLRGLPVFDKENGVTRWLHPSSFPKTGQGLIFFDEMNLAPPLVQASSYQLILSRLLGEYKLPKDYSLIAAGNRITDRANIFDLAAPLANRQGHVELRIPSAEEWTEWAITHSIDMRIIGFLNGFKQTALHTFDPKSKEKAFATPRTWAFASDLIKDIKTEDTEELRITLASIVGEALAGEVISFLKLKDKLYPIKQYIEEADTIELPEELSLQWTLITSLVEYFRNNKTQKTLSGIVKLCMRFSEEYSTFLLKLLWSVDTSIQSKLKDMPEATELAKRLYKFLR